LGVQDVMPVPASVVKSQIESVLSDLNVTAVKIGMVPNAEIAHVIASILREYKQHHKCDIIYDPVMISTSGKRLMEEDCIEVVKQELFPLCTLITPNIPEAECLLGHPLQDEYDGYELAKQYHTEFLIKGGHRQLSDSSESDSEDPVVTDYLYAPNGSVERYKSPMLETHNLHGTGCTLSSAIAAYMVDGYSMLVAIKYAKMLVTSGILKGKYTFIGKGNGPLVLF